MNNTLHHTFQNLCGIAGGQNVVVSPTSCTYFFSFNSLYPCGLQGICFFKPFQAFLRKCLKIAALALTRRSATPSPKRFA
jgi:hypothetical protein